VGLGGDSESLRTLSATRLEIWDDAVWAAFDAIHSCTQPWIPTHWKARVWGVGSMIWPIEQYTSTLSKWLIRIVSLARLTGRAGCRPRYTRRRSVWSHSSPFHNNIANLRRLIQPPKASFAVLPFLSPLWGGNRVQYGRKNALRTMARGRMSSGRSVLGRSWDSLRGRGKVVSPTGSPTGSQSCGPQARAQPQRRWEGATVQLMSA
jgi:hypothetical protein